MRNRSNPGRGPAIVPPFPWTDRDFAFHARASLRRRMSADDATVPVRGRASRGYADASLRDEVAHRIVAEAGDDALDVVVTVREGIVMLEGPVPERVTKEMLQAIVEACPGVRGVDNRLRVDWIDQTPSAARAADAPAEPRPDYLSSTRGSPTTTMRRTE